MNPLWRDRLVAVIGTLLAIWLGYQVADGALGWPLLAGGITLAAILVRLAGIPLDVLVLGVLLVGYIIGNRGFAQLTLIPGFPLLPAEVGLLVIGGTQLIRCAFAKRLPWRRDPLHYILLIWIVVGTGRAIVDLRHHGLVAARDFAMVYYAAFFFLAQGIAEDPLARRFLVRCLVAASVSLPVVFFLSEAFPEFFLVTLTFRGVPLIFFKGDLAPTFFSVSAVTLYFNIPPLHRIWARPLATGMILWVLAGDNRASMLGALGLIGWLAFSAYRRFSLVQVGTASLALLLFVAFATFSGNRWAERRLEAMSDRALSVVDIAGRFSYQGEESLVKTDNNRFRWVWWQTVTSETLAANPVLGLGFGYDLARGFLQAYNPEMADDFTARSPHNILVTTFGRMGLAGLLVFLTFLIILFVRTRRVVCDPRSDPLQVTLWVSVWPIAISAMLGVVLEGPMGAVVFWSLLGLANALSPAKQESPPGIAEVSAAESRPIATGELREMAPVHSLASSSPAAPNSSSSH